MSEGRPFNRKNNPGDLRNLETKPWHRHYDYNVPTTVHYPPWSIPDLLGIPSNAFPDKAALTFYGSEMTFWELRQQVLRMANALGALGIKKGERVGRVLRKVLHAEEEAKSET